MPVTIWIGEASKVTGVLAVLENEAEGRSPGVKAVQYRVTAQRRGAVE